MRAFLDAPKLKDSSQMSFDKLYVKLIYALLYVNMNAKLFK